MTEASDQCPFILIKPQYKENEFQRIYTYFIAVTSDGKNSFLSHNSSCIAQVSYFPVAVTKPS